MMGPVERYVEILNNFYGILCVNRRVSTCKCILFYQITNVLAVAQHVTSTWRVSQSSHGALWLRGTSVRKGTRKPKRSQEVPRGGRKVRMKVFIFPCCRGISFFNRFPQSTASHTLIFSAHVEIENIIHFLSFVTASFYGAVAEVLPLCLLKA